MLNITVLNDNIILTQNTIPHMGTIIIEIIHFITPQIFYGGQIERHTRLNLTVNTSKAWNDTVCLDKTRRIIS